jgi:hypothetical protein
MVLLTGCGGQSRSENAGPGSGAATSVAGSGPAADSGSAAGGDHTSYAGTMSAGGAQAGNASDNAGAGATSDNARAGATSAGDDARAGSANGGSKAVSGAAGEGGAVAGAAGTQPAVAAACSMLCAELSDCPDGGGGFSPNCTQDCADAIDLEDRDCAAVGVEMLSCLTSALHEQSDDCSSRFALAKQTCESAISAYRGCTAVDKTSALCVHLSVADSNGGTQNCMEDLSCLNGLINNLRCFEAPDGTSSCSCFTKFSRTDVTVNESTLTVCKNRFAECLASGTLVP